MPSSRAIKPPSDETRSNNGERPKSLDILRRMCKQAAQANRDTSSAPSSSRDTGKRSLSAWEVKQLEEMPIGEDGKRAEKQIVLSERATPEKPGLYGSGNKSSSSRLESDYAQWRESKGISDPSLVRTQIMDSLKKGKCRKAIKLCDRLLTYCKTGAIIWAPTTRAMNCTVDIIINNINIYKNRYKCALPILQLMIWNANPNAIYRHG